jgi:curli biogenesis system outer membrane secretion channel CsgG
MRKLLVVALLLPALGGCTVLAVGGAAVSVASAAVSTTYAVTKGAVNVATYPFRDSEEEKEEKRKKEEAEKE